VLRYSTPSRFRISAIASTTFIRFPPGNLAVWRRS
jgi:hypothetical protein